MVKRKNRKLAQLRAKRARMSSVESVAAATTITDEHVGDQPTSSNWIQIKPEDIVENKVDIIINDVNNKNLRSLTIWGTGLGVEKTIAVVEALKRNHLGEGTRYLQEASIKAVENEQPHLQVIITLLRPEESSNPEATSA